MLHLIVLVSLAHLPLIEHTPRNVASEDAVDAPPPPSYGYRGPEWAMGSVGLLSGHALTLGLLAAPTSGVLSGCDARPCAPNTPTLVASIFTEALVAPLAAAALAWAVSSDPHAELLSAWRTATLVHVPFMLLALGSMFSLPSPVSYALAGALFVGDVVLGGLATSYALHPDEVAQAAPQPPPSPTSINREPLSPVAREVVIPLAFRF